MTTPTISEAVKALVDALREHSPKDRVTFNLFVNCEEARITTSERSAEQLKAAGISMRNLAGNFIKESQ
jgi:hypothetical protein